MSWTRVGDRGGTLLFNTRRQARPSQASQSPPDRPPPRPPPSLHLASLHRSAVPPHPDPP